MIHWAAILDEIFPPVFPESIQNGDGYTKQAYEMNAGKRIVEIIRKAHPKLGVILTADDLYAKEPCIPAPDHR